MAQLLVKVDDDVAKAVRRIVEERYGGKRGALSLVVEQALREAVSPRTEISVSSLLEIIDYVSRATTDRQSRSQILTNVFLMLDREFEQSIERGMADFREGKLNKVSKGQDPVKFLRELAAKV
ncbi:MAG TPA: hypothetical protein VLV31_08270 [Candidatus Acidoferrales bacterium]|nr:hypothetical protein [Candidatus Acidoferrales bacterium]